MPASTLPTVNETSILLGVYVVYERVYELDNYVDRLPELGLELMLTGVSKA